MKQAKKIDFGGLVAAVRKSVGLESDRRVSGIRNAERVVNEWIDFLAKGPQQQVPGAMRLLAMVRDGFSCRDCGMSGFPGTKPGCIRVHRLDGLSIDGRHALSNLITLCTKCQGPRNIERRQRWRREPVRVKRKSK